MEIAPAACDRCPKVVDWQHPTGLLPISKQPVLVLGGTWADTAKAASLDPQKKPHFKPKHVVFAHPDEVRDEDWCRLSSKSAFIRGQAASVFMRLNSSFEMSLENGSFAREQSAARPAGSWRLHLHPVTAPQPSHLISIFILGEFLLFRGSFDGADCWFASPDWAGRLPATVQQAARWSTLRKTIKGSPPSFYILNTRRGDTAARTLLQTSVKALRPRVRRNADGSDLT